MAATVSGLSIYPLKSGHGISLREMRLTRQGPENDRTWMVVHDDKDMRGKMITQRERGCEKLALVRATPQADGGTVFTAWEMPPLHVPAKTSYSSTSLAQVWGSASEVIDCGNKAAQWISSYLGIPARLVRQAPDHTRKADRKWTNDDGGVSLADGFPLLVTSSSSFAALRAALPAGGCIDMDQFRPNIVIDGLAPFEEDTIHEVRIGEVVIEFVKPCTRCQMIALNQDTGARSGVTLPMITALRGGKTDDLQGAFFGQNAIIKVPGIIRASDKVEILSRKPLHPALAQCALKPSAG